MIINLFINKWRNFSSDLQNYLVIRIIGIIIFSIVGIIFSLYIKKENIILFYYLVITGYFVWLLYIFIMAALDKIFVYEGICEKRKLNKASISTSIIRKNKFDIYGKCNATMLIKKEDSYGNTIEAKFIVPIGYNYEIDEGNILKVYAFENSVFPKNENTYIISNPIIIKVAKN